MNELATHPLLGIELFSGTGMLGEGLRAGLDHLGIPYRTICHVEREAYAASVLVARMEEGSLDAAPIWADVTTFDASAWRGKVDCIAAGFPCQDLSVAGKRAGLDGKRSGLFFEVTRIAADSGAWLMLLENVAGIATATASVVDAEEGELDERAAARVVGELADLGWDAEWLVISASDVGASHGRARWFCVAWRMDDANGSERRPCGICGSGGEQGDDGERKADSGSGISSPACLDDSDCAGAQRSGRAQQGVDVGREEMGNTRLQHQQLQQRTDGAEHTAAGRELANTNSTGLRAIWQPECRTPDTLSIDKAMAVTQSDRWHKGWPESGREQGRSDVAERSFQVADTGQPRPQRHKQSSTHEPDGRARTMPTNYQISS